MAVGLIDVIEKLPAKLYLVTEYCSGGDIASLLREKGHLEESVAQKLMHDLARALRALWQLQLVHRDVKPQNLLLSAKLEDPDCTLKVADFGFARALGPEILAETLCGSPLYMAPEILLGQRYDAKADLWSCGAVLYEMLVGKPPFSGRTQMELLQNIQRNDVSIPIKVRQNLSDICQSLIFALLRRNPVERISFEEFFNHPFISVRYKNMGIFSNAIDTLRHKHDTKMNEKERIKRTDLKQRKENYGACIQNTLQETNVSTLNEESTQSNGWKKNKEDELDNFVLVAPEKIATDCGKTSTIAPMSFDSSKKNVSRQLKSTGVQGRTERLNEIHQVVNNSFDSMKLEETPSSLHYHLRGDSSFKAAGISDSNCTRNRGKEDIYSNDSSYLSLAALQESADLKVSRLVDFLSDSYYPDLSQREDSVNLNAVPWQSASRFEFLIMVGDILESMALHESSDTEDQESPTQIKVSGTSHEHSEFRTISRMAKELSFHLAALHVYALAIFNEDMVSESQNSCFDCRQHMRDEQDVQFSKCESENKKSSSIFSSSMDNGDCRSSIDTASFSRKVAIEEKVRTVLSKAKLISESIKVITKYNNNPDLKDIRSESKAQEFKLDMETSTTESSHKNYESSSSMNTYRPISLPNPWNLAHRAAIDWAVQGASEELLGNHRKCAELYAQSGLLLYFFGVEADGLPTIHDLSVNDQGDSFSGLDPPRTSFIHHMKSENKVCSARCDIENPRSKDRMSDDDGSHLRLCAALVAARWAACSIKKG